MKKIFWLSILIAAITLGMSGAAFALPCNIGGVSGSVNCQNGEAKNDFPAPGTVNAELFFDFYDWEYIDKYDVDKAEYENDQAFVWTVTADDAFPDDNGDWSFSAGVWAAFEDVMIVVKAGKVFSGYLLNNTSMPTSGTWDTGNQELSHLTLYARGDVPIPEPATMLLLGFGLVGLAGLRRKKFKK